MPDPVPVAALERTGDEMRYRRIVVVTASTLTSLFAVGAAFQFGVLAADTAGGAVGLLERLFANFSSVLVIAVAFIAVPVRRYSALLRIPIVLAICGTAALARMTAQALIEVYPIAQRDSYLLDLVAALSIGLVSVTIAMLLADYEYRLRLQERTSTAQSLRAAQALEALQAEELRVRREVAEGLHGTVQQRLVLISVEVQTLAERLRAEGRLDLAAERDFARLQSGLDQIREQDVREMSQLLYPNGIDLGLSQAVRMLMRRVPAAIAAKVVISPRLVEHDDPAVGGFSVTERLNVVRLLEEGVTNALRHGGAAKLELRLDVVAGERGPELSLTLDDDGSGVSGDGQFHGLRHLVDRIRDQGGVVDLLPSPLLPGARLQLRLPVVQREAPPMLAPAETR